jgi:response regulator RpfG family c-di-GMP phosphodiesterase
MATKKQTKAGKPNKKTRIPILEFIRFKRARDIDEVKALNNHVMDRELAKETRIAERLEKQGRLKDGNGLEMFLAACRRRLKDRRWHRVLEHSDNVRRYAFCIARSWETEKRRKGNGSDLSFLNVVAKVSGYHDIGKTLTAPYLINREDGTWLGIGKGQRIDFRKELKVLRLAHIKAGVRMLGIYQDYMTPTEFDYSRWIIQGHHVAFDGVGTAGAPSYPEFIDGLPVYYIANKGAIPDSARIIRCADVYSAIMENRFYLAESERVVTRVTGMAADDAALGLLIAVSGTDVDPEMVKCLMTGKYHIDDNIAKTVVSDLSCSEPACLQVRGGDIRFALTNVIDQQSFHDVISMRNDGWDDNTDFNVFCAAALA